MFHSIGRDLLIRALGGYGFAGEAYTGEFAGVRVDQAQSIAEGRLIGLGLVRRRHEYGEVDYTIAGHPAPPETLVLAFSDRH